MLFVVKQVKVSINYTVNILLYTVLNIHILKVSFQKLSETKEYS